jgi:hypothetical protein
LPATFGGSAATFCAAASDTTIVVNSGLSFCRNDSFTSVGAAVSFAFLAGCASTSALCAQAGAPGSSTASTAARATPRRTKWRGRVV